MRQVTELSREALEKIAESVQGLLYLDLNRAGTEYWNPDKSWDGADVCQELAGLLDRHGLVPDKELPYEPASPDQAKRFVLYDFDLDEMASNHVYDSYQEAADDAGMLNNVIVVALPVEPLKLGTD